MLRHITAKSAVVSAAALVAGSVLAGVVAAQDLGLVYVFAMNQTGQPITDLTSEEFSIAEGETQVKVVSAQIGTEPMKIALLVDNGAGLDDQINPLRDGLVAFLETLPPQHLVGLFTIGGQIQRRVDFTTDRAELLAAARAVFPDRGNARYLDGIRETLDRGFDGDEAWPVFVAILTDSPEGSANMNDPRYNRFVGSLVSAGVTIHAVHIPSRQRSASNLSQNYSIHLTGTTGGRYAALTAPTGLQDYMTKLATDMGAFYDGASPLYRVIYERPDPPEDRVSVSVERQAVEVYLFGDRHMP